MPAGTLESSVLPAEQPIVDRVVVRARPGWRALDLRELWHYRELLFILAGRDIKVRYKQTALGILWAIIPAVMTSFAFDFIFTLVGSKPTVGVNRKLMIFCGMVPWQLFANSLSQASNSLVGSQNLITKVYFPRLVIPISSILSSLLDFAIACVILIAMMCYYHDSVHLTWGLVTLPLFIALAVVTAFAVGLWLSALNVRYRDVRYVIPFLVQIWMLASPVVYSADKIPEKWQLLYSLNPMAGVIEGFRWALLGESSPPAGMLAVSIASVAVLLTGGLFYFRRMEKSFADLV